MIVQQMDLKKNNQNKRKINKIIFHKKNLGKGAAIRTAQSILRGNW